MAIDIDNYIELPKKWNPGIIFLSFLVGFLGSYTTTYLLLMIERSKNKYYRIGWLVAACFTFGIGCIWVLHFTGMMAIDVGVGITYNLWKTLFSCVIAMFGAVGAFYLKYRNIFTVAASADVESLESVPLLTERGFHPEDNRPIWKLFIVKEPAIWAGGAFKTVAIAGMHYTGMWAMIMHKDVVMDYNFFHVSFGVIICFFISIVSVNSIPRLLDLRRQVLFAFLSTSGVFVLHYLAMYSTVFYIKKDHGEIPPQYSFGWAIPLTIIIISSSVSFVCLSLVTQSMSRQRDNMAETLRTKSYINSLEIEREILRRENSRKTDFMAIASHELRTPLHAIAGFIELVADTHLDEEQKENIDLAQRSIKVMGYVVDNVLNFSKLEKDEIEINKTETCLTEVLSDLIISLAGIIEKPFSVYFIDDTVEKYTELCDVQLIIQVIQNLVSNAYKFTEDGFVIFTYAVRENKAVFTVEDTGIGIADSDKENLFTPYHQIDTSLSRRHTGTGLGLTICKRIATALQGEITFTSEPGLGSTFVFTVPITITSREPLWDKPLHGCYTVDTIHVKTKKIVSDKLRQVGLTECLHDDDSNCKYELTTASERRMIVTWNEKERGSSEVYAELQPYNKTIYTILRRPINLMHFIDNVYRFYHDPDNYKPHDDIKVVETKYVNSKDLAEKIAEKKVEKYESEILPSEKALGIPIGSTSTSNKLLLVAEDNEVNQRLIDKYLKKLHYDCHMVENGKVALQKMKDNILKNKEQRYFAVLMDCQMPEMDGFESTKLIREFDKETPILALTANVSDNSRAQAEDVGMNEFLSKPLRIDTLKEALGRIPSA